MNRTISAWIPWVGALLLGACGGESTERATLPEPSVTPSLGGERRAGSDHSIDDTPEPDYRVERIILITVDTLRADYVGAYGGDVPTPALDGLAKEGLVVEGFCTPTPSTAPAHVSLFSGLYPWNHGAMGNAVSFEESALDLLPRYFQEAGFSTAAFVSSYVLHPRWGFGQGFDDYHFEPNKESRWKGQERAFSNIAGLTTNAALKWIETHADERFFVWLHWFDPHHPYHAPKDYRRPDDPIDLEGKSVVKPLNNVGGLIRAIRGYRGEVTYVDAQLARLLQQLEELDLAESTAIVLTADHGEGLGDHNLLGHGANLHDELVLVPLLMRLPGVAGGRRLVGDAQLEDLMPTLLSIGGLRVPSGLDGRDLLPWLVGERESSPRPAVLGMRASLGSGDPPQYYERRGITKWIGELEQPGMRYDLGQDPRELAGQAGVSASDELRATLLAAKPRNQAQAELDQEALDAMQALGYMGDADGTTDSDFDSD